MSEQHHQQHDAHHEVQHSAGQGLGGEKWLGEQWAAFRTARASLAEVMSDDELRSLGINLEVLDERL